MKKNKVIPYKNIPARLPIHGTITIVLFCDRFNIHGWVIGIIGTLLSIVWVSSIYMLSSQEFFETLE